MLNTLKSGGGVGGGGGCGDSSECAGTKRPPENVSVGSRSRAFCTAAHAAGLAEQARGSIAVKPPCEDTHQQDGIVSSVMGGSGVGEFDARIRAPWYEGDWHTRSMRRRCRQRGRPGRKGERIWNSW